MADVQPKPAVKIPTLEPIPYVVVKLANGKTVLRHPDEVKQVVK
jgi:hypothetical protein